MEILTACNLEKVKTVAEILDDEPLFSKPDLEFYQWVADYFMHPLGKTLAEIIPAGSEKKDYLWITPLPVDGDIALAAGQNKIINLLQQYPQGIALNSLAKLCNLKNISSTVRSLHLAGLLQIAEKQKKQLTVQKEKFVALNPAKIAGSKLTRKQEELIAFMQAGGTMTLADLISKSGTSSAIINRLHDKGIIEFSIKEKIRTTSIKSLLEQSKSAIVLNAAQEKALHKISGYLEKNSFTPMLLHGVTGSGKTEVYLQAIASVLKNNGTAIYLVPEIALTPQLISRIQGRFIHEQIAVLHSGIAESVRYDQWRQIKRGEIKFVIGARSALFAPLPDLKLIIVDEEHDASYKQDDRLCYHARDLAVVKAKLAKAVVVLGSATPGVRTYFNTLSKKYHYLELPERIEDKTAASSGNCRYEVATGIGGQSAYSLCCLDCRNRNDTGQKRTSFAFSEQARV